MSEELHLSDQQLLQALDGELSPRDTNRAQSHLAACWACRSRQQQLEAAIGEFIRLQRGALDPQLPSAEGPRALLKAQLAQLSTAHPMPRPGWLRDFSQQLGWVAVALALTASLTYVTISRRSTTPPVSVTVPNPSLTPGATVLLNGTEVCEQTSLKNKLVPIGLQRRVFAEYGIGTAVEPEAYEVDYLITPALGGADDIRNLWPQSRRATVWNAQVKDALEDHLRDLVCNGQLDLATAQREIAGNWIEAYKKYFHTTRPLETR